MNDFNSLISDDANNKTILLVEDDILIAVMEMQQLEQEGYRVIHVASGEEAITSVLKNKGLIDLILMDIDLGYGLDGTEAALEILKTSNIPILFLSSRSENEIIRKIETINSYGYISKSSNSELLIASIKMAFKLFEANQKIHREREELGTILQSIGDAVIATDTNARVIKMNSVAEKLTGWTFKEAYGKTLEEIFKIINSETRLSVQNPVAAILVTGNIVGLANHTILISKDLKEYQIADSGAPIKDSSGKINGVVLVFRDVTQEYEVQRKIEESEKLYHSLFENMLNGFAYCKMFFQDGRPVDFTYLSVNKALEKLTGLKDIVGKKVSEIFPGILKRDPELFEIFGRVSLTEIPETFEAYVESLKMWFEISVYSPQREYFVTIFDVITDRKEAESVLRASEEKYSILFKKAAIPAVLTKIPENIFVDVNDAFEKIFEYTRSEVLGKTSVELGIVRQEDQEPTIQKLNLIGFEYDVEKRVRTKSGQIRVVRININRVNFGGNDYAISTLQDVTERNLAEEKIQKLLKEKEVILKEVHHRIKNNMHTVLSLLSIQAMNQENPIVQNVLIDAAGRVKSMMVMYDKLYRSEDTGEASLKEYLVSLSDEIVNTFPQKSFLDVKTEVEDIKLGANILSPLGIILNELITNSMKYAFTESSQGNIFISASINNNKLLFVYEDNGIGIPESVNLENSKGFGLQLVKMQVKQLKGSVRIERKKGTKFFIQINL